MLDRTRAALRFSTNLAFSRNGVPFSGTANHGTFLDFIANVTYSSYYLVIGPDAVEVRKSGAAASPNGLRNLVFHLH